MAPRGSAGRVLVGNLQPPASLANVANLSAARAEAVAGRVVSAGSFQDPAVHALLAAALPESLRPHLRASFEWYACRGAFFHTDAHYGDVLFGAWCVAGPSRHIAFPRCGLSVAATAACFCVFDPFEPHGVLDAGETRYDRARYEGAAPSVFVGFEIELAPEVCTAFGIGAVPPDAALLSSATRIHPETGGRDD